MSEDDRDLERFIYRSTASDLGRPIRLVGCIVRPEPWLPTYPGTNLEFATMHGWTGYPCRACRMLARLRLWRPRTRHIRRRHPPRPPVLMSEQPGAYLTTEAIGSAMDALWAGPPPPHEIWWTTL